MKDVMIALLARLDAGRDAVLVRVIGSTGSAPRGPGASMLVDAGGYAMGTVGGGSVEHAAIQQAAEMLASGGDVLVREFALRNREAGDLGMVCGGDMRLLFQRVAPERAPLFREALDRIGARRGGHLVADTKTGEMWIAQDHPNRPDCFAQPLSAAGLTHVFGAGHVARALVPLLARTGFCCVVMDDRPEFADPALFPGAERVRVADFERLDDLALGARDHAVVMTRGHGHDQCVLSQVLRTEAGYIGMIGSRSKRAFVYASLREQGFSEADIARVHSPIGLPIGAETPEEIAVSIAAELIAVRAGQARP